MDGVRLAGVFVLLELHTAASNCPSKIIESIQHPLDFVWKGNDWI